MSTYWILISAIGGYLIGSISSARIITRLFGKGKKIPETTQFGIEGSDKKIETKLVSATSVSVNIGPKFGFLTYLSDVLKVFIPVLILKLYFPNTDYFLIAAFTGVVGHIWPVYHNFRGGRGISAIYGGVLAIDWLGVPVAAVGGMILGLFILRDLFFTYQAGLWLLIPWLWFRTHDLNSVLYAVLINVVFTVSSIPEMKNWFAVKKEKGWSDPAQAFQVSAMGRGIMKMANKIGFFRDKTAESEKVSTSSNDRENEEK